MTFLQTSFVKSKKYKLNPSPYEQILETAHYSIKGF